MTKVEELTEKLRLAEEGLAHLYKRKEDLLDEVRRINDEIDTILLPLRLELLEAGQGSPILGAWERGRLQQPTYKRLNAGGEPKALVRRRNDRWYLAYINPLGDDMPDEDLTKLVGPSDIVVVLAAADVILQQVGWLMDD